MISLCYESTNSCNLECDYCITADNKDATTGSNYKRIINSIAKWEPERLVISGGEPLLDETLLQKLDLLNEKCPNTYISLSTNGTSEFDFSSLKGKVDCIDFSLPALDKEIYKSMRGKDLVDTVIKNIKEALEYHGYIRLSYVLTKVNCLEVNKILEFAKEIGIKEVRIGRFFPFRTAARPDCRKKYELTDEEIEQIIQDIENKEYSFKLVPPIKSLDLMENGYLTVDHMGKLFLPTVDGKKEIHKIFDINKENIEHILKKQDGIFKNVTKKKGLYEPFMSINRIRESEAMYKKSMIEEFLSDRSRIIYSSSFRRLQQKAQVFSLESNSSVRSRLTHSLEVSDVGKILATRITKRLMTLGGRYSLEPSQESSIVSIVENACLLHDIGNPPFGHFGEEAVKSWWRNNCQEYIDTHNKKLKEEQERLNFETSKVKEYLTDLEEFDGNPQGVRIITRLHSDNDKEGELESGLNLTYSTILCSIKYTRYPGESFEARSVHKDIIKKCGHFYSEKIILDKVYSDLGLKPILRFPWVYIMEAADDIAYAMSDIADGIEKGIVTVESFLNKFRKLWRERYKEKVPEEVLSDEIMSKADKIRDFNKEVASKWASIISNEVVEKFVDDVDKYLAGTAGAIISGEESPGERILTIIKIYSRKVIYRSPDAEDVELAGYSVISGLLEYFGRLLTLTYEEFSHFILPDGDPQKKHLDLEWRIFNKLSKRCVNSYLAQFKEWEQECKKEPDMRITELEWWLRAHLIVDHISGMTDDYALKVYQVCKGINVQTI